MTLLSPQPEWTHDCRSESEVSERQQYRSAVTTQAYQEGILLGAGSPASTTCRAL
jgi:hypothetical protein